MKQTRICTSISVMALAVFLTSCGGGGDAEAGSPTAFSVQPTTITATAPTQANGGPPAGNCSAGYAGEFFIYGGVAPYRLDNVAPDAVVLDRNTVSDRGGSFQASFTGTCVKTALIVIVDKLDKQIVLTLNNNPAGS